MLACQKTLSDDAVALVLPRVESLNDLPEAVAYYINAPMIDNDLLETHCHNDELLAALHDGLRDLSADEWHAESIKQVIKQTAVAHGVKFPQVGMPLRVLLTGRTNSPDIAAVAAVLGRESTLARLRKKSGY